jgi:hypothetical protein
VITMSKNQSTAVLEAPVATAADTHWHRHLAELLIDFQEDRPRASGGVIPGTTVADFLHDFADALSLPEQARTLATRAREQALTQWRQSSEYRTVAALQERIREAQAAADVAHREGTEAEDCYEQATLSEDESTALTAKKTVLEVQAKLAFHADRIAILRPKLKQAEEDADVVKAQLLRDHALALRSETECDWDDNVVALGRALEKCLPALLLPDEIERATSRDL